MKKTWKNYLPFLAVVGIVLLDQLTKFWAVQVLLPGDDIAVIPDVFYFAFATNNGAAWSMLAGQRFILLAVSCVALVLIGVIIKRGWVDTALGRWGVYFVLGGAIGNLIDRAFRAGGLVVDMFDFRLINFPIFNVADIFITVGGVMFALFVVQTALRERRAAQESAEKGEDEDAD